MYCGSGVYNDQSPRFVLSLAGNHIANDGRVPFGVATTQVIEFTATETKVIWPHLERSHLALDGFSDRSRTINGHFVESVCAMDNPSALRSQQRQRLGKRLDQSAVPDANDLPRRPRRIC